MRSGRGSRVTRGPCSDAKNNCMLVRAYASESRGKGSVLIKEVSRSANELITENPSWAQC